MLLYRTRGFLVALAVGATCIATSAAQANAQALSGSARQSSIHLAESVVYTFPDGSTQTVSSVVAKALDRSFNGSGVTSAYSGSGLSVPGFMISPASLRTGDIAVWNYISAIVVVKSGTVKIIVSGSMTSFSSTSYGGFRGFYHPS